MKSKHIQNKQAQNRQINEKQRAFMKPGKDNKEDRLNFIKFWAEYVKTHSDKDWSKQQNVLIDSQIN